MFKKRFLILSLCLLTSMVFALEIDYKKFMEDYAKAYSNMDSKELNDYVSKKFLSKLQWEFHGFRKFHKKPQLILTDIIVKENIISCNATLTVGGKIKYKHKPMAFVINNGKIEQQLKQTLSLEAVNARRALYNARDFWSAAKRAEAFAVVKVEKYKSAVSEKLLPLPKDYADEKVNISRWVQFYAPESGQYLVPVAKSKDVYNIVGMGYKLPPYNPKSVDAFVKQWEEFKGLDQNKEVDFLKKLINGKSSPEMLHSAIARLSEIGYFKSKLTKDDIAFWGKLIFDAKQPREFISYLIYNLTKDNFDKIQPILEQALKDGKLTTTVAPLLARRDAKRFKELMLEWLQDDKMRKLALRNSFILMKDKEFLDTAMKYFKNSGIEEVRQYLLVLLAKDNAGGNAVIREILQKQAEEYKKLIPQIYMIIIRTNNPAWINEVINLAKLKDAKGIYARLKPAAMAYLCRNKSKKGVELTKKYLEFIKDDKRNQQMCLMTFSTIFKKRFKSVEEIKDMVAANDTEKKQKK